MGVCVCGVSVCVYVCNIIYTYIRKFLRKSGLTWTYFLKVTKIEVKGTWEEPCVLFRTPRRWGRGRHTFACFCVKFRNRMTEEVGFYAFSFLWLCLPRLYPGTGGSSPLKPATVQRIWDLQREGDWASQAVSQSRTSSELSKCKTPDSPFTI